MPTETVYSVNIGTFNAHLTSWLFEAAKDWSAVLLKTPWIWLSDFDDDQVRRATAISERVLLGDFEYDIIALNEVFHEDARSVLVDALKGRFPFFVSKSPSVTIEMPEPLQMVLPGPVRDLVETFAPGDAIYMEDSGLMLFSRFPIETTDFVLFEVPIAGKPDCFAAKGALYARIINMRSGRQLHVVATHMQESKDEWAGIRASELNQISALVAKNVEPFVLEREDIIILGDMNVIANLVPDDTKPDGVPSSPEKGEYRDRFADDGTPNFFNRVVHDTWARHTSARDRGATHVDGNRLDLILHNEWDRLLVPQHLTLGHNLCTAEGEWLSDHLALNAEFNHDGPLCTPRRAAPAAMDTWTRGRVGFPAAMEWYRVDDPGTYGFAAVPTEPATGNLTVTVYGKTDLSRPLGQYRNETVETFGPNQEPVAARKFVLTKPPYYVRVRHAAADWVGDYQFWAHRLRGQSKAEAIQLVPYVNTVAVFNAGFPHNSEDTMWFVFDVDAADSGQPQHVEMIASGEPLANWTAALLGGDGTTALGSWAPEGTDLQFARDEVDGRFYFLISRDDPTFATTVWSARWTTNLTILHGGAATVGAGEDVNPLMLICDNETDPEWGGSDSISMSVWVDGTLVIPGIFVGNFEEEGFKGVERLFPSRGLRYLEKVEWQVIERDISPDELSAGVVILPLVDADSTRIEDQSAVEFAGGVYRLTFNRRHWLPTE